MCSLQDSFVRAVTDWIILGAYTGYQKSKWCNNHPEKFERIIDPQWGSRAAALAVIAEDFSFMTATGSRHHDIHLIANNDITYTTLCIRKPKSNDNGQRLTYRRQNGSTLMCPTQASIDIIHHAKCLCTPCGHPIAVYCDASSSAQRQITSLEVATFLRHVAHKTFNIPPQHPDLKAWSCHSIHVTAANLFHCARFSDSYIKNRLWWHSDTFLMYLHNTFYMASQHTKVVMLGLDPPTDNATRPLKPHEDLLTIRPV